jgi:putative hemolysin
MIAKAWYEPVSRFAHKFYPGARDVCRSFATKIDVELVRGRYLVKTATSSSELMSVLRLRYEVFHKEFQGKRFPIGLDLDSFDASADHLIIIDQQTGLLAGTYRLISSDFSSKFYSENEFVLDKFLRSPGKKLELGRACIHKNYRTGVVLNLLWRGVCEYARAIKAEYLFGCASIKTMDPLKVEGILDYLDGINARVQAFDVKPTLDYEMPMLGLVREQTSRPQESMSSMVPALLHSYIKMGGRVIGAPALDRDFKCIDLFTVLDLSAIDARYERKFLA